MIVALATFLALVVAFIAYDRRSAGGRRMQTRALQPRGPTPIDLARRRAGSRHDRIGPSVGDARAVGPRDTAVCTATFVHPARNLWGCARKCPNDPGIRLACGVL